MKTLIAILWLLVLLLVLSLGFRTVIWHCITPITVTVIQLPWLNCIVNLGAVFCSILFLVLLKFLGGKPK